MTGKGFISEGDVALLLRRYTTSTILTLLQEVLHVAGSKLDWRSIVKSSNTGITNAREYQTLWRHLAYRSTLSEKFEDDAEPMGDDSDLEFEVEPLPGVSPDVAANVAACVKVLAATGSTSNNFSKNQDASFVIDIPNSSSGWEVRAFGQASNVIVPGTSTPESQPARKKRKLWTSEEDQELIAAVEKCGEGNWATMLKGAFKHDRTAAQLSQRWALIRKRRDAQTGNIQGGIIDNQAIPNGAMISVTSQVPVEGPSVLPAVVDLQKDNNPGTSTGVGNLSSLPTSASRNVPLQEQRCNNGNSTSLVQSTGKGRPPMKRYGVLGSQQSRTVNSTSGVGGSSPSQVTGVAGDLRSAKSAIASVTSSGAVPSRYNTSSATRSMPASSVGHPMPKSPAGPDPMVQAAAVAAGARIAPASAAASLLKAAHAGNVVHIGPGGVAMGKVGTQSQMSSPAAGTIMKAGSGVGSRTSTSTLVHYIRTGTGSSQSLHLTSQKTSQGRGQSGKSGCPQTVRSNSSTTSSGPIGPLQKSQASTVMSGSGIRGKTNPSPVSPNEGCTATNEVAPTKGPVVEEISPISDGITIITDQEGPLNCSNGSASACVYTRQKHEGKLGLTKSHEGSDQRSAPASSITTGNEEKPASSLNNEKVDDSNKKDGVGD